MSRVGSLLHETAFQIPPSVVTANAIAEFEALMRCPQTGRKFNDPVLLSCGLTIDRSALGVSCAGCGNTHGIANVTVNYAVKSVVDQFLQEKFLDLENHLSCTSCYDPYEDQPSTLKLPLISTCGHSFCQGCWTTWLTGRNTCPTDRKEVRNGTLRRNPLLLALSKAFSKIDSKYWQQLAQANFEKARSEVAEVFQQDGLRRALDLCVRQQYPIDLQFSITYPGAVPTFTTLLHQMVAQQRYDFLQEYCVSAEAAAAAGVSQVNVNYWQQDGQQRSALELAIELSDLQTVEWLLKNGSYLKEAVGWEIYQAVSLDNDRAGIADCYLQQMKLLILSDSSHALAGVTLISNLVSNQLESVGEEAACELVRMLEITSHSRLALSVQQRLQETLISRQSKKLMRALTMDASPNLNWAAAAVHQQAYHLAVELGEPDYPVTDSPDFIGPLQQVQDILRHVCDPGDAEVVYLAQDKVDALFDFLSRLDPVGMTQIIQYGQLTANQLVLLQYLCDALNPVKQATTPQFILEDVQSASLLFDTIQRGSFAEVNKLDCLQNLRSSCFDHHQVSINQTRNVDDWRAIRDAGIFAKHRVTHGFKSIFNCFRSTQTVHHIDSEINRLSRLR